MQQVFSKADPDELGLTLDQQTALLTQALQLDFLTTPLTGFTDQLATRSQEPHVSVWQYTNDVSPTLTPEAQRLGSTIGMTAADFNLIGEETRYTPFANLISILTAGTVSPFKPVTHGQFRFTKLNVIDRFGQMIHGVSIAANPLGGSRPGLSPVGPVPQPILPCLGEAYSVQENSTNQARTVLPRTDAACPFVQLPPSINQNARVNSEFLTEVTPGVRPRTWRPAESGENPVKGWLIANYANNSVQVFSPDGRFIREYSVWNDQPTVRPFAADNALANSQDTLLIDLLGKFTEDGYLINLYNTISNAVLSVQASPSHYAESIPSAYGKPLALVAFG